MRATADTHTAAWPMKLLRNSIQGALLCLYHPIRRTNTDQTAANVLSRRLVS
jgi:hypothetical protein